MLLRKNGLLLLFLVCVSGSIFGKDNIYFLEQTTDSTQQQRIELRKNLDPWFGKDKIDHFLTSAFLVGMAYHSSRDYFQRRHQPSLNFAVGFSIGIGIGKEIWDKTSKKGNPSYRDLLADLAGVGLGFLIYSHVK